RRVRGVVEDETGQPVAHADVFLHGTRIGAERVARADRNGTFVVPHLLPRTELQARRDGYEPSLAVPVPAAEDDDLELRLVLAPGGCIVAGRVTAPDGVAVPRALVGIVPGAAAHLSPWVRGGPQRRALFLFTDESGRFR